MNASEDHAYDSVCSSSVDKEDTYDYIPHNVMGSLQAPVTKIQNTNESAELGDYMTYSSCQSIGQYAEPYAGFRFNNVIQHAPAGRNRLVKIPDIKRCSVERVMNDVSSCPRIQIWSYFTMIIFFHNTAFM